ncbi:MAG: hypothetical protein JSU98_02975 [Gemmatimonadales bacterium]|jgi:hypothetical protein|nr:MAG: hypothetical protein JSU98_02975 [Gemmatimonadales bacterium]
MCPLPAARSVLACLASLFVLLGAVPTPGLAQATPGTLSEAVRVALETQTPDSVLTRFTSELQSGQFTYRLDLDSLGALGRGFMEAGEMEKGAVVMGIVAQAAQIQAGSMFPDNLRRAMEARQEEERRSSEARREAAPTDPPPSAGGDPGPDLGPARDDLERFHGLYANPEQGPNRAIFLITGCEGRLLAGAMWGDVAPWELRSEGATEFSWPGNSFAQPFRLAISVGADGRGRTIQHDMDFVASPLERIDDLPEEFAADCERGR